jgi:hypothetical protein
MSSFVQPWLQQTIGAVIPSYVPGQVRGQQAALETLDIAQYAKSRRLMHEAGVAGEHDLVSFYKQQQAQTMSGALISGNRRFIRGAVPRPDRRFYTAFSQERDPAARERILGMVSPMFGTVLQQAWGEDITAERSAIASATSGISGQVGSDWPGWHPDIPVNLMAYKIAKNQAWDFHDLGISNRESYLAEELFANYTPVTPQPIHALGRVQGDLHRTLHRLQASGVQLEVGETMGAGATRVSVRKDSRQFRRKYQQYDSPAQTGMRF